MVKSLSYLLLIVLVGCNQTSIKSPQLKPLAVEAEVQDSVMVGPSALNDPDRFVWGASVVKGKDGKYHMLYSTWECGDSIPPFSDSWILYSKIAYAISDKPDRDFKFQKIVLEGRAKQGDSAAWDAQTVHNPHIKHFDDKYYLYYVGSSDPGSLAPEDTRGKLSRRNRIQQSQKIGLVIFDDFPSLLSGKYKRSDQPILSPRTRVKSNLVLQPSPEGTEALPDNLIVVNPSVEQRPDDGKFLLYFKGNVYDPHWKGIHGVAVADSPSGPFKALDNPVFEVRMDNGKLASAEDPFVWHSSRYNKFFVVVKDFTGNITGGIPGLAMMESTNGIDWEISEHSFFMKKEVITNSGATIKLDRLERPQLYINEQGIPEVLYCAASIVHINPRHDGKSFNIHIPVKFQ